MPTNPPASPKPIQPLVYGPRGPLDTAQTNALPLKMHAYFRDTALPEGWLERYTPGLSFREPTFCDASEHFGGLAARHRYVLLSGNARHVSTLFPDANAAGLCMWQPDSRWKVLSVLRFKDHAQITLLEIPPESQEIFTGTELSVLESGYANRTKHLFRDALKSQPLAAHTDPEWLARLELPLGIKRDGDFLECWRNGLHQGDAASTEKPELAVVLSQALAKLPTGPSEDKNNSATTDDANNLHQITRHKTRSKRIVGGVFLLIGLGLGIEQMVLGQHVWQFILFGVCFSLFGALLVWHPAWFD
jgi:hypothetical protein